jgi:hypothetical protein
MLQFVFERKLNYIIVCGYIFSNDCEVFMGKNYTADSRRRMIEGAKKSNRIMALAFKVKDDERRIDYEKNPKLCLFCDCKIEYIKRKNKFCNRSCGASFNNKGKVKNGTRIEDAECVFCKLSFKPHFTSSGKYCSNRCQQDYEKEQYVKEIEDSQNANPRGHKTLPNFIKSYFKDKLGCKCSICNESEWMGKEIPLVLDHIDGHSWNDELSNFRLVCGNCDMQLPTYKNKNKGNGRHNRRQRYKEGKSY